MDAINNINSSINDATGNGVELSVNETPAPPSSPTIAVVRNVKAAINFMNKDTDSQFIVDSGRILTSMAGNKAFPTPSPDLPTLTAARNAYIAAVSEGLDSRIGRSNRQKQRLALVVLLRQLVHYVEDHSGGDVTTLLSSGFFAQRAHKPVGPLPVPDNVRLVRGKLSGQAIARCKAVDRANAYQWRLAPATTPTAWSPVITTFGARNVFAGLVPMTSYIVQVCAVGTAGAGDWSGTATQLVL